MRCLFDPSAADAALIVNIEETAGPPFQVEFTLQDSIEGIASIVVTLSMNADTVVPPFIPGTTDPIVLTSTKIDQTRPMGIGFIVTSATGTTSTIEYPAPEPASLALITIGVGAALIRRRRRAGEDAAA